MTKSFSENPHIYKTPYCFLFTIKEDLISYIRKACINPQELFLKNNELIKKLELISELFERD